MENTPVNSVENVASKNQTPNPFLEFFKTANFGTPDLAIPFDRLQTSHYLPALDEGLKLSRQRLQKIRETTAPANFENTILAIETCTEAAELVTGIYFNLFGAEASPEHQALAKDISPVMAALQSEINLDPILFNRVKEVFEKRQSLGLTTEQTQLVEKFYKMFVRNGALLATDKKEKLKAIDQELAVLSPKFSENVLNATNAFELWIENADDLKGLPEGAIEAAAMAATQKGKKGQWFFNLQMPSLLPVLQYLDNRQIRQKMWTANSSKSFNDKFDNQEVVRRTVQLRAERAQLLGFATHAAFVLEERMAETPEQVFNFLEKIYAPSKKAADQDLQELRDFRKSKEGVDEIMPWDFAYYSEKLKAEKYAFNAEDLRPYFKLENVVQGVFEHARKLFQLNFKKRTDIPIYHRDVEVFEVTDVTSGENIGLFYTDFFPRDTKRGGAWMTTFRDQGFFEGQVRRPHVSIVCNFTKPTDTKPSLLSYDEVQTLFHEFGHALHGLLSKCNYRSLSGTNVYWDFVELPSQIMENWTQEKEGLDLFARHYQTGESIPADLIQKMIHAQKFQAGYTSLRQVNFAYLDMKWHTADPSSLPTVEVFENQATERTRMFPVIPGTNMSCGFSHIFAGGYSAGYYSYKWAEVLDADAFEFFKEKGLFNAEVSAKFKDNVLSRGGTEHPMVLYKRFRGREPDPEALLRRDGLQA